MTKIKAQLVTYCLFDVAWYVPLESEAGLCDQEIYFCGLTEVR